MLALVTGGTGFIGSHLVEQLSQRGYSVRCLVRKTSNLQWLQHLNPEFRYGDLFDNDVVKNALDGVDIVFHSAGVTKAKRKEEYYHGNQFATKNFLAQVTKHHPNLKKFVHISSQAAVGPSFSEQPIDETVPFHPITTYGKSKMEAERECFNFFSHLPLTIVRPPTVFGERDTDVYNFFKTVKAGIIPMIGFNRKAISIIHAADLVNGVIGAGESEKTTGQTYFLTSSNTITWESFGKMAAKALEKRTVNIRIPEFLVYGIFGVGEILSRFSSKPSIINWEKARDATQQFWTCSSEKAKQDFGFRELFPLEERVRQTIAWYKQQGWL